MTTAKAESVQKEMEERNLRPRLCYLTKGECGYGFHLHGERSSGAQFIRRIEAGSPAELAGLRSGDRVVEVNGENVEKLSHQQVVQKIMEVENRTRLLVVDRETDEFLLLHSLPCTEDLAMEMSCLLSPRTPSSSLASSTLSFSSSSRNSLTPSPHGSIILSPRDFITHSLSGSITPLLPPKSITSADSGAPLPSDSVIPSPQNSTPPSPRKSLTASPADCTTQSSRNSINQSPFGSITQPSSNSFTQSPDTSTAQSPTRSLSNSSTPFPYDSITQPSSNSFTQSPDTSTAQSPTRSLSNSSAPFPYDSITQPSSNSFTQSPDTSTAQSPTRSLSNSSTPFPYDSITQPSSNSFTQSPDTSTAQSPTRSLSNSSAPFPYDSITQPSSKSILQSPSDFITTPFTREKPDKIHIMDTTTTTNNNNTTNNKKETSGTEDMVMHDLRPRLCHIVKDEQGFGFNLHCDKRRVGQFIRSVDPDSPAQRAGLQPGDRLIQVNGRSIEGLRHSEVVEIIRGGGGQTKLLVVDPETDTLFQKLDITPTTAHLNEDCVDGPLIESPTSACPVTDAAVSPSKVLNGLLIQPPATDLPPTGPPSTNGAPKIQSHGKSSTSETSGSDTSTKVLDSEQRQCHGAPSVQEVTAAKDSGGLHLSPTAAEARQKARLKKANKRAPPMAWNKKYEIFSNF